MASDTETTQATNKKTKRKAERPVEQKPDSTGVDSTGAETRSFQAETKELLDLMIHSLYSEKEIFLRELISNASDAIDRLRFEALTQPDLQGDGSLEIRLEVDPEARTLTIHDNGIGMSRQEVIDHIGTIAKSGTRELIQKIKDAPNDQAFSLIGQFGVGFYSSFMVADRVSLVTRRANERQATSWESTGDGTYQIGDASKVDRGTSITLHLKPANPDGGLADFTQEWTIQGIVKKYSDFVRYPVILKTQREEVEKDAEGKPKEGGRTTTRFEDKTLNSMKAIWTRRGKEVTEEEYAEFYKQIAHDWDKPLRTIPVHAEGRIEYNALLFIPQKAGMDLYMRTYEAGLQLYVKNVKIMDRCEDLLPTYFRFVRGVVDSPDLPLNVSREILQNDGQLAQIRKGLVKKLIDTLRTMQEQENEVYRGFWTHFGRSVKEGIAIDAENRDKLVPLALFESSAEATQTTTLKDYISRMKEDQQEIFYLSGESRALVENSPHLEAFKERGYEVLFLTDPVDEFMMQWLTEFDGKKLRSITKGSIELGSEEDRKKAEETRKEQEQSLQALLNLMQRKLDEWVKEVRLSARLTSSAVCLVSGEFEQSAYLERLLQQSGQSMPKQKRILEVNANHPVMKAMKERFDQNASDPKLDEYAELLFGQAILAEGSDLPNPARFSQLVADLMARA